MSTLAPVVTPSTALPANVLLDSQVWLTCHSTVKPHITVTSLVWSPHHYGHPRSVHWSQIVFHTDSTNNKRLTSCNTITSPLRSLFPVMWVTVLVRFHCTVIYCCSTQKFHFSPLASYHVGVVNIRCCIHQVAHRICHGFSDFKHNKDIIYRPKLKLYYNQTVWLLI